MKYLILNSEFDALAVNHAARQRLWPKHPAVDNPNDTPYLWTTKTHPDTGQVALCISQWEGALTEDEQLELVDELDASWTPPQEETV